MKQTKEHIEKRISKMWITRRKNGNDRVDKDTRNKISKTLAEKYASGELVSWQTGLTKETDERIASMGEQNSKYLTGRKTGRLGKHYEEIYGDKSDSIKKKIVSSRRANNEKWTSDETCAKLSEVLKGKPKKIKINYSIAAKNRVDENNQWCSIGNNETKLLDEQEKIDNCKIIRQYKVGKYRLDGYCPETNTVYEVYEKEHKQRTEKDLKRQKRIEECLKCKFVIIWDKIHETNLSKPRLHFGTGVEAEQNW